MCQSFFRSLSVSLSLFSHVCVCLSDFLSACPLCLSAACLQTYSHQQKQIFLSQTKLLREQTCWVRSSFKIHKLIAHEKNRNKHRLYRSCCYLCMFSGWYLPAQRWKPLRLPLSLWPGRWEHLQEPRAVSPPEGATANSVLAGVHFKCVIKEGIFWIFFFKVGKSWKK